MTRSYFAKRLCLATGCIALMSLPMRVGATDGSGQAQQSSARSITDNSSWALRLPKEDKVVYRGEVSLDEAGMGTTQMLYPAPNAVGFLAAVFTHGALVESEKKNQKERLQNEADKVLTPYEAVLSTYTYKELMQEGLQKTSTGGRKKLAEYTEKPGAEWLIECAPVFLITQDQSAIILENSISIYAPEATSTAVYRNIVKVISETREEKKLPDFWTANQGEKLKDESANLFAQSIDMAINDMANGSRENDNAQKTFRYLEGHAKKFERGQLVSEQCNRIVIKNLRGWLMSIPATPSASTSPTATQCADASNRPK